MNKQDQIKTTDREEIPEAIIRQHRHWTHWIESNRVVGEGNLILTNRRLLFLHRIEASPEVTEAIKKLADAPIAEVLDHALSLHKHNFQVPLSSMVRVGVYMFFGFPLPRFCLSVFYLKGKKFTPHTADFQFKNDRIWVFIKPQIVSDWGWKRAIGRAIRARV